MECHKMQDGAVCNVSIEGKFTFADHQKFKAIFDAIKEQKTQQLVLDTKNLEFVDSAALGLLLLLRDEAEKQQKVLRIKSPGGQAKKMFEISRFYELFSIEE